MLFCDNLILVVVRELIKIGVEESSGGDFARWEVGNDQILGWWVGRGLLLAFVSSAHCRTGFLAGCVLVR